MGARPRQGICLRLNRHRQFGYLQRPRSGVARPGPSPYSLHCLNRISTNSLQGLVAVRSEIGPCLRLEESLGNYFADAGNAGNLSMSRASCWMMTVALRFAAIFLRRSSDATVWARSKLNAGTPSES
jgi:hypothetical protein